MNPIQDKEMIRFLANFTVGIVVISASTGTAFSNVWPHTICLYAGIEAVLLYSTFMAQGVLEEIVLGVHSE